MASRRCHRARRGHQVGLQSAVSEQERSNTISGYTGLQQGGPAVWRPDWPSLAWIYCPFHCGSSPSPFRPCLLLLLRLPAVKLSRQPGPRSNKGQIEKNKISASTCCLSIFLASFFSPSTDSLTCLGLFFSLSFSLPSFFLSPPLDILMGTFASFSSPSSSSGREDRPPAGTPVWKHLVQRSRSDCSISRCRSSE